MNIIIPMAGMGKRMRPHTLTTAKPLIPVAGKPVVQHLVESIVKVVDGDVENIAFIISEHFGTEVENNLKKIAKNLNAEPLIVYQKEALGTAHAIYCAEQLLSGEVIVAFADTLFLADFKMDKGVDGTIWVHKVEDPRAFGVVKLNDDNIITDFIEKPEKFISDLAIIGIYHFRNGESLKQEIKYLLDNDIKDKGEYQLTNALENMKQKGMKFKPGEVKEWWDCGNKNATVYTNQRLLTHQGKNNLGQNIMSENTTIIEPCTIADNVVLKNTVIGPHVSIGSNTTVENSEISNSIIQTNSVVKNIKFHNSMIGNNVTLDGDSQQLSIGDYNTIMD
jgi:glucose-1-phosphate thymidylyltransferase